MLVANAGRRSVTRNALAAAILLLATPRVPAAANAVVPVRAVVTWEPGETIQLPIGVRRHNAVQVAPPMLAALTALNAPTLLQPRINAINSVPVNNPAGEFAGNGNTQMEPAVASCGDTLVCAFTDSRGLWGSGTATGFATSLDGGQTWVDGGSLPNLTAPRLVFGDPTLLTDGYGRWYCLSELDRGNGTGGPGTGDLGCVLHRGQFVGNTLVWGPGWMLAGGVGLKLDTPHLAIDTAHDRLYVAYSNLTTAAGAIEVVTLDQNGSHVRQRVVVQPEVAGVNQSGTRVAVGPNSEVYCVWESGIFGVEGQGPGVQKISRSLDWGVTFSPPVVVAPVVQSWFSGPPGANREEESVEYPSIAVDHSTGPNRGRVYLAWHDAVLRDFTGPLIDVAETTSPNGAPQDAQVLPATAPGQFGWHISGSLTSGDYSDWYRFDGQAGDHVRMVVTGLTPLMSMRLTLRWPNATGGGADTTLAASMRNPGEQVLFQFTLPVAGTYYVALYRENSVTGPYVGYFRRAQATLPSTAIDHRDIVVVSSPDGVSGWTPKVRVNDDTGFTDQAYPEILVDGDGAAHVAWYDRRFDPRSRVLADVMLASSFDGGQSFVAAIRVTDVSSWWQVPADVVPNFGDQFRPAVAGNQLHLVWADGQTGDPDVRYRKLQTGFQFNAPSAISARSGRSLGLTGTLENDTPYGTAHFQVQILSDSDLIPDSTWTVGPVAAGAQIPWSFDPIVGSEPFALTVAHLSIVVTSDRSSQVQSRQVDVHADVVGIALQDFAAHANPDGGVRLEWRASPGTRFAVERGDQSLGPFAPLAPVVAGDAHGAFEFDDTSAAAGRSYAYRLAGTDAQGAMQMFGPWVVNTALPARVVLHGAQPNPFNPTTTIRFDLPQAMPVTLRVLDAHGRCVAVVFDHAPRAAGTHAVVWDARDRRGTALPSGVYWTELQAPGVRLAKRIVLLR